ncbi:hypothetical protein F5144DRAFT_609434 [Chaetomium tenue]|uniref:Uncharacterized protein n=1 Tax=Chaetomium tenue TaxID=1854479 RepID=A0ACB7PJ58_9PEZI|nr:hypothetical protein F5144DRAFT_609434 [Chaetomium globosum]
MAESELQVGRLDLATRALDLTTSLLTATSTSNFLLKGAWEIGQWLGRERLNQHELLDCMEKAKGLAFANRNGLEFFDKVVSGTDALPVGPLFLQQSGSLGRLMAGDPNLNWIVSTVAGLFQHHSDDRLVAAKVTALIMGVHQAQRQGHEQGNEVSIPFLDASTYKPTHGRLNAVVTKIASSVWFNVVNVGCDTIPLPQELLDLCPTGHYLAPSDFGLVISTIHTRCRSKAVLRTDHLLRDVLQWLLLHYDGTIIVNTGGQIVYRADLGNRHRELEVRVSSVCSKSYNCGAATAESYKILHDISGSFEEFLAGASYRDSDDLPQRPGIRQKLYDIPQLYSSFMYTKDLENLVETSAQLILRWLLKVPLFGTSFPTRRDCYTPGFDATPGRSAEEGAMTVALVLERIPAMINLQWGNPPASLAIIGDDTYTSSNDFPRAPEDETPWTMERRFGILLDSFPALSSLGKKATAECWCPDCSQRNRFTPRVFRPGCLIRTALEDVLLLLAHGIADGFGVNDVSSGSKTGPIVEASCVYLGCPFETPPTPSDHINGATSFAAIQFGNLATSAPWLDLSREIVGRGCFGLVASKGRLGVVTKSDRQEMQFRTVEDNFAIIETEMTEDTALFTSRYKKAASNLDRDFCLDKDKSAVESDVILWQADDKFYRLLLRVKTNNHWRAVDPSSVLTATIEMPHTSARCQHAAQPPEMPPSTVRIYTLDEVVGRWPEPPGGVRTPWKNNTPDEVDTYYLTNVLDTHMKKNVTLAISVDTRVVLNFPELACLPCTLRHASDAKRKFRGTQRSEAKDTSCYIINLGTRLADRHGGALQIGSSVDADG